MFNYNLLEKPQFDINTKCIDSIFKSISNKVLIVQKGSLNIVFLDDNSIKNLNKQYRKIDKTTDVLSFHYFEDFSSLSENDIAWEIILSESKIITQWVEYKLGSEKEFYKLIIHSILHILGYDHEDDKEYIIMKDLEDKIWLEVFWK